MVSLDLEGLVKRYDRVAVVDFEPGGGLTIAPGELVLGLGPAGAGKTTIARLIAGLETPDAGEVRLDGRSLAGLPPEARKVGMMFQGDALWPHLSVASNVGYALKALGIGRRERRGRVGETLLAARLDGLGDRRPGSLSPLQRRRVDLARALVVEPLLLILDDPLGPLPERDRAEFRDELRRAHEEARLTTLALAREPGEALALADRVAALDLGRVVQVAEPGTLYDRPANAFAARLLGPVNLIQGQLEMCAPDAKGEAVARTPIGRLVGRLGARFEGPGSAVSVAIRPEALGLGSPAPHDSNRFAATIERLVFRGAMRSIQLRGPNGWPLSAIAFQATSRELREGQSLTVSVPAEAVLLLPSRVPAGAE